MTERAGDAAGRYDAHAFAQRLAARDLLATLRGLCPSSILEPGCGTGIYTEMLLDAFPAASIDAFDTDSRMLAAARRKIASPAVRFALADAGKPVSGCYDAVTSNATLQWLDDLSGALANLAGALKDGGALTFSLFGPLTYCELDAALKDTLGSAAGVTAAGFADETRLAGALKPLLRGTVIEQKCYHQVLPSLRALLSGIRYTGAYRRHDGPGRLWTPRMLDRIERAYLDRYGRICVTYQVFMCRGVK